MATSLKLFYTFANTTTKWQLNPEKLLIIDNVEDYLALQSYYSINDFQYIKNQLELGINVDISQSYSQPKSDTNFKYVAIQNAGEKVHYYFVKNAIWRSKSCVRFELVMDVLNTFKENSDYVWKANTKITREHKDRIIAYANSIINNLQLIQSSTNTPDNFTENNDFLKFQDKFDKTKKSYNASAIKLRHYADVFPTSLLARFKKIFILWII